MAVNLLIKISSYFKQIWFLWAFSLLVNIITLLVIFYYIKPGGRNLILKYNILTGAEWSGNGNNIYLLPGIGLILAGANFILYRAQKNNPYFLPLLPVIVSISVQLIIITAVLFLARIN